MTRNKGIFIIAVVVLLAGCGKSTTSSTTTTTTSSTTAPSTTSTTAITSSGPVTDSSKLTADGLSGVRVGQTVAEARASTGQTITVSGSAGSPPQDCSASISGVPTVSIYLTGNDSITAIEIHSVPITTAAGVGLGTSIPDVEAAYPNATRTSPTEGPAFIAKSADAKHELFIKTDGKKVIDMLAGTSGIDQIDEFCG